MLFARSISMRNFVERNMPPLSTRLLVFAIVMGSGFCIAVEESLASNKADEFTAKDIRAYSTLVRSLSRSGLDM